MSDGVWRASGRRPGRATAMVAVALGVVALVLGGCSTGGGDGSAEAELSTVEVVTTDLVATRSVGGEIAPAEQRRLPNRAQGIVTALPEVGALIDAGETLFVVNEQPVVLLLGEVPAYRTMGLGDVGSDVEQLERGLAALGFDAGDQVVIDRTFDEATALAVGEWQTSLGLESTGAVELGRVVFSPEAVRVLGASVAVGEPAGGAVLEVSSLSRVVLVRVDADVAAEFFPVGVSVGLEIDGEARDGVVLSVRAAEAMGASDRGRAVRSLVSRAAATAAASSMV
jgi:peptidoglycan hydrolase-like protein with peptidoglycan-binding domain